MGKGEEEKEIHNATSDSICLLLLLQLVSFQITPVAHISSSCEIMPEPGFHAQSDIHFSHCVSLTHSTGPTCVQSVHQAACENDLCVLFCSVPSCACGRRMVGGF